MQVSGMVASILGQKGGSIFFIAPDAMVYDAIQMMADPKRKKPLELVEKCRKTFRIVDNMPLPEHHKVRHQELYQQFSKLKEEKRNR